MLWMNFNKLWPKTGKTEIRKDIRLIFMMMLLICLSISENASALTNLSDSVGVEKRKGLLYILHKVQGGETLYSISRKYGAPVRELIEANNNISVNDLAIGDTLRVPFAKTTEKVNNQKILAVHEVQSSETLYSISRKYGVDVQEIRTWNQLGNQPLAIGQRLIIYDKSVEPEKEKTPEDIIHIVKQGETLYSLSKNFQVSVDQLIAWNQLPDASIDLGDELIVGKKQIQSQTQITESTTPEVQVTTQPEKSIPEVTEATEPLKEEKKEVKAQRVEEKKEVKRYEKVTEMGFASPITGITDTQKYLALHRTASVGTIIQIRNEMNNLSVFVRVVGKLPGTGVNEKIAIRITKAAYESLGGIDDRIPVEISYIP